MNVVAIIQARMGSTRLPGKMLMPISGKPVIAHVVERAKRVPEINEIWLATTTNSEDDALAAWAEKNNLPHYRGSVNDVLDRYYQAAKLARAEVVVRITGDCPLIDPEIVSAVIMELKKRGVDYAAVNRRVVTYPDGLDVEVFTFAALERAWKEARLASEREHVTPYIWKHPRKFSLFILKNAADWSRYRLTLDEPSDRDLLQKIFKEVHPLTTANIMKFLDIHSEARRINERIKRDDGYAKSLKEDVELPPRL